MKKTIVTIVTHRHLFRHLAIVTHRHIVTIVTSSPSSPGDSALRISDHHAYILIMKLERYQVTKIAAEAECDLRTVIKVYNGEATRPMVRMRVIRAARKLKIAAPADAA